MDLNALKYIEIDNEKNIVAFLDILGFKSHVKSYFYPENDSDKEILDDIKLGLKRALNSSYASVFEFAKLNIGYNQFSDCTCLSIPDFRSNLKVEALMHCCLVYTLREFYLSMLIPKVYLIRGGLSVGFHYENDNMIFSEGLINAYELESKKAVYPRIILDDKLIERFKMYWITQKDTLSLFSMDKILVSDWDGSIFINPFNNFQTSENMILAGVMKKPSFYDENKDIKTNLVEKEDVIQINLFEKLQSKIRDLRQNEVDDDVLAKYIWLKELLKWNMDPDSSKIKFEYLLK